MRLRIVAAATLSVALALTAASVTGARTTSPAKAQKDSITVWLMTDAQSNWPDVVKAATASFQQQHAGVDVNVQYQSWGDHLTKLDASLAGGNAPDVVELGNTETTKYMAAGALADLSSSRSSFPNVSTWLKGLTDSVTYNGKLYGVPYYAGARAVIYRTDLYRQAGVSTRAPQSLDQFIANNKKLMAKFGSDANFSAVYFPGKYWYAGISFVYDYGGQIAVRSGGKWKGALDSANAVQGLTKWKQFVSAFSHANKTGDENNPQQALVFAKGKIASFIGNGWEWPYSLDPKVGNPALTGKLGAFPMPSHVKGQYMPTFLGGSDLAVPVTSKQKALAVDWIKAFTSSSSMRLMASSGGVIPNTTSLVSINASKPTLAPFARAAKYSWFVPASPNWVNVESANVLQNMLVSIVTGRASVQSAAKKASGQITSILNA